MKARNTRELDEDAGGADPGALRRGRHQDHAVVEAGHLEASTLEALSGVAEQRRDVDPLGGVLTDECGTRLRSDPTSLLLGEVTTAR